MCCEGSSALLMFIGLYLCRCVRLNFCVVLSVSRFVVSVSVSVPLRLEHFPAFADRFAGKAL